MPETDITKMKVADLKRELKLRGLPITGNKTELQDRLHSALIEGELSLDDTAISGEDLLDEDAVLTDEEEHKILATDENDLLSPIEELSSTATSTKKISEDTLIGSTVPNLTGTRKIVLKRKTSSTTITTTTTTAGNGTINESVKANDELATNVKVAKTSSNHIPITIGENKKDDNEKVTMPSKISQLTPEQRLEMRAKKFGLDPTANATTKTVTDGTSKLITGPTTTTTATTGTEDKEQIDILKKRAERFGCVVSSKIAKLDAQEKLLKRKERFGGATANSEITKDNQKDGKGTDAWAEKARLRLERFKTAPTAQAAKN